MDVLRNAGIADLGHRLRRNSRAVDCGLWAVSSASDLLVTESMRNWADPELRSSSR